MVQVVINHMHGMNFKNHFYFLFFLWACGPERVKKSHEENG